MRIAHFSDLHINSALELERAVNLVRHALRQGVDHIVVTGDLVDAAQVGLVEEFWHELRRMGWASSDRATFAPGNHDVFPLPGRIAQALLKLPNLRRPTTNWNRINDITRSSRKGSGCSKLVPGEPYPVGKVLSDHVVLVALDTTRNGQYNPQHWAEGELPRKHVKAVRQFFREHGHVRHRIVALHHTPWYENIVGADYIPQNFAEPSPAKVLHWLEDADANFVLCGHIHCICDVEKRPFGEHGLVLRAGTAGGMHEDDEEVGFTRAYHIVDLPLRGRRTIRRVELTGDQLCRPSRRAGRW